MGSDLLEQLIDSIHELKEGQDCLQRMMIEIKVEFGKIEERLQNGSRRFDDVDRQYSGLEERVRKLENKLTAIYAIAGAIGALAGILPQILAFLIRH